MKVLIFFCLVACCCAAILPAINIHVNVGEDGAISLIVPKYQISMSRSMKNPEMINLILQNMDGQKYLLNIEEPQRMKLSNIKEVLDAKYMKHLTDGYTQLDILDTIFLEHEGIINDITYNTILHQIEQLTQYDVLDYKILTVLRHIDSAHMIEDLAKLLPLKKVAEKMSESKMVDLLSLEEQRENIPVHVQVPGQMVELQNIKRDLTMDTKNAHQYWNMKQDLTEAMRTPVDRLGMLLKEMKQRQYEQTLLFPQQMYTQQYYTLPMYHQEEMRYNPMYENMYEKSPLNNYLMKQTPHMEALQQWYIPKMQKQVMDYSPMTQMYENMIMKHTPQQWMYEQTPQDMMLQKMMYQHMNSGKTMTEEQMEQYRLKQKLMEQQSMLDEKMMQQETLKEKMMQQEMMKEKMMQQEMLKEKMMQQEMLKEKMMHEEMMEQMMKDKMMSEYKMVPKMMDHRQMYEKMWMDQQMKNNGYMYPTQHMMWYPMGEAY